ncbi:MAG: DUF4329 domain-containing protein [Oscillospiraceae bacterium]|nr:DUF4329 domain-containing protein [Oscillospiraceae bacterium]
MFESEDEAAKEFGNYTNGKSIEDNREYASYIYKVFTITHSSVTIPKTPWYLLALGIKKTPIFNMTVKTQFSYIPPQKGGKSNVIGSVIWFALRPKVAMLHTRAAYDSKYGNDIFSPQDKGLADLYKVPFYVATPLGTLRKYDPADGSDIELFNDLPFDQNHPDRK